MHEVMNGPLLHGQIGTRRIDLRDRTQVIPLAWERVGSAVPLEVRGV